MDVRNKQGRTPYEVAKGIGGVQQNGIVRPIATGALIQRLSAGPSAKN